MWCLVGVLALAVGCSKSGDEVIRLKDMPEMDMSEMAAWVEFGPGEISDDALWVNVKGKAKVDFGASKLQVNVTRFTAEGRLDKVAAYVKLANPPVPEMPERPTAGEEGSSEYDPMFRPPILPPPLIVAGDEVIMAVDATTNKGVITKLVLKPMAGGGGMMR